MGLTSQKPRPLNLSPTVDDGIPRTLREQESDRAVKLQTVTLPPLLTESEGTETEDTPPIEVPGLARIAWEGIPELELAARHAWRLYQEHSFARSCPICEEARCQPQRAAVAALSRFWIHLPATPTDAFHTYSDLRKAA